MVLIFDLYTLDKVCEMDVDVTSSTIEQEENYDKQLDLYSPDYSDEYATADDFPKIQNWNKGKYILVGVGATEKSKMFYEFRIYDSSSKKLVGTFHRQNHEDTKGLLKEVEFHKEDEDTLIFLMVEGYDTKIVEADIIHNRAQTVSTIICNDDIEHLRITEDLSTIYFI